MDEQQPPTALYLLWLMARADGGAVKISESCSVFSSFAIHQNERFS